MVWAFSLSTIKLSPDRLTPVLLVLGIRSLAEFGNLERPLVQSVLYHQDGPYEASPKAISERTSYHGILLAFHPYPQLIQAVFNQHWFGPPSAVTRISSWPRVDHPASRLIPATERPIQTRFRCGSLSLNLATEIN